MFNLIEDVSILTQVNESTLDKFINVSNLCIGHAVHETICKHENITEIDIGIGKICLKINKDSLSYRFVPSKELEKLIVQTISSKNSPIVSKLEGNLQEKIDRSYKELL